MRDYFKEDIQEALDASKYTLEEMSPSECSIFREMVSEKFSDGRDYQSLFWEAVGSQGFAIRDNMSWKWLDDYLKGQDFILFFEKSDIPTVFIFPKEQLLTKFLQEFTGTIFYITNKNLDFLISYNDSDYLHCIGSAENWLRNKAVELSKTGWKDMDGRSFA